MMENFHWFGVKRNLYFFSIVIIAETDIRQTRDMRTLSRVGVEKMWMKWGEEVVKRKLHFCCHFFPVISFSKGVKVRETMAIVSNTL